jgi:hypothetical protein
MTGLEPQGGTVDKPADGRTSRFSAGIMKAKERQKQYRDKLEKHPLTSASSPRSGPASGTRRA